MKNPLVLACALLLVVGTLFAQSKKTDGHSRGLAAITGFTHTQRSQRSWSFRATMDPTSRPVRFRVS